MKSSRFADELIGYNKEMRADRFVFIIGAQKCATTSLYASLVSHPEVCPCIAKEPEFFSEFQSYGVEVDRYRDLWPEFDVNAHTCYLEASTGYTKYPWEKNVPERIYDYGLRPRFIYVVRNPIDRIESHLNFDRIKFGITDQKFTDPYLINLSRYALQLKQYLRVFPDRRQYLIVDFDALKKDPKQVLQRCYHFMGVRLSFNPELERKNVTPNPSVLEIWMRKFGLRKAAHQLLPDSVRRSVTNLLRHSTPDAKLSMPEADRAYIYEEIYDDMQEFRRMFQFDVEAWGF